MELWGITKSFKIGTIITFILMLSILVGCQNNSQVISEITFANYNRTGQQTSDNVIRTIRTQEYIDKTVRFIEEAEKMPGILQMTQPHYVISYISKNGKTIKEFYIYIYSEEESGTLVDIANTEQGYTLSKEFVEFFVDIIGY